MAIYNGNGVGEAAADVGLSIVGVISPMPGTGLMLKSMTVAKVAKGLDNAGDAAGATKGLDKLKPGQFAKESVPARGPTRNFTKTEREKINELGSQNGCHTCGAKEAGTKSGNFILDHQPPNALNSAGGEQQLFPHCKTCSQSQAGQVTQAKRKRGL